VPPLWPPARRALLAGEAASAAGARGPCPLDSRNFFEKKLSKSFISPAGGMGTLQTGYAVLGSPPERMAGRPGPCMETGEVF